MNKNTIKKLVASTSCLLLFQSAYAQAGGEKELFFNNFAWSLACVVLLIIIAVLSICLKKTRKKMLESDNVASQIMEEIAEEKELLGKIEKGFENEEFKMYLQFIVDNKTKQIVSAEALSRWELASGEIVPPIKYIAVMEKYAMIAKLDYYMFETVCKKLSEWKDILLGTFTISCNFTRITISEKDFVSKIKEISDKYEFDKRRLLIEITEDAIEKNHDMAMENIFKVKELGFRIALDDIGSGYTSLINLCEYPLDVVKVDRNILLVANQTRGRDLFLGIISLAHSLKLKVVCEGVETEEQNSFVTESVCDYIQGWYYSKAMPELQAEEFAREYMEKFV